MTALVIEFKNLVESCGGLSDGNTVSVKPENPRPFVASNASGQAVMRSRDQVQKHAKAIAQLMLK